jgi:hypothetical protein
VFFDNQPEASGNVTRARACGASFIEVKKVDKVSTFPLGDVKAHFPAWVVIIGPNTDTPTGAGANLCADRRRCWPACSMPGGGGFARTGGGAAGRLSGRRHVRVKREPMHLKRLRVENFRALEKIDVEFDTLVSVIIGPNAIGKTTVLEAIRLAKGLLAPRTQSEPNQVLISLGAMSPHMPQRLLSTALTNRPNLPLIVKCSYQISEAELANLRTISPQLGVNLAQQSAGITFGAPAQVVAFLNSPMGQQALQHANKTLDAEIVRVEASKRLELNLTINFQTNQISGEFPVRQLLFAALDQALAPSLAWKLQ